MACITLAAMTPHLNKLNCAAVAYGRCSAPNRQASVTTKSQTMDPSRSETRASNVSYFISRFKLSTNENLKRSHCVDGTTLVESSKECQLPLALDRRHFLVGCLLPMSLFGHEHVLADQIEEDEASGNEGDEFGFDGLGKSADDYVPGKVVAVAQAGEGAVLFLGVDGFELPLRMVVGAAEAMAILTAAQERRGRRPVTHEAWGSSLAAVGWKVDRVAITSMENDLFYSRLVLSFEPSATSGISPRDVNPATSSHRSVDMRPSDGIALALRCRAPLFICKKVAEEIVVLKSGEKVKEQIDPLNKPGLQARGDIPVYFDNLSYYVAQSSPGSLTVFFEDEDMRTML